MTKCSASSAFFRLRLAFSLVLCFAGLSLAVVVFAQAPKGPAGKTTRTSWPSLEQQLAQEYLGYRVQPGSALAQLIRDHQDFSILHYSEKAGNLTLPAWLRVWWQKEHPEGDYKSDDPTGGYPRALNEILEWMMTHQDLKAGPGVAAESADADSDASIGGDVRMSGAQSTARSESDIRVNFWNTQKILSASNSISSGGAQAVNRSTDGGTTWAQTTLPLVLADTSHSDPTVDWTSDSTAWSSTLGIQGGALRLRNYRSTDNGATWALDATASGAQTNVDKQMVWVDHSASSSFKDQMYAVWHNSSPAFVNRRTAGVGGTWLATPIQVSGAESTGTCIGSDIKSNSAGDVFASWPTTGNSKIFLVRSTDGGATWNAPVPVATTYDSYDIGVPSFSGRRALVYVSIGAYRGGTKNHVYVTWTDLSGATGCTAPANEPGTNVSSACKTRVWFNRSTDGGLTWGTPTKVNDQPGLNDQFNQWLAVDETSGNLGLMYYDTVDDAGRKKTNVYYQGSANAGASWSPAQKVSAAQTDETISGADTGNQYGDYNGLSGYSTLFLPSWTDRRNLAKEEVWTSRIIDTQAPAPAIVTNGSTITAGTCGNPTTSSIEPGEDVTVNFCVRNDGTAPTTNLVATLAGTGGVTNQSGSQSFGALAAGGGSACRSFSFTATGTCGGTLTATLQLQDGATSLGNAVYTFTSGTVITLATQSFDGVTAPALPAGWSAVLAAGTGVNWVTSTTTPDTAPNAAFVDDPTTVSDKQLISEAFSVSSATTSVSFRHNYIFEAGFDGGVLEISSPNINGGAYTDVTNAAVGGSFTSGGYGSTISTAYSNPLAARQAWSGNSGGYITTVAKLGPSVAGQSIRLRFRMGSDSSVGATGWRVDTIKLQDVQCPCAPIPVTVSSRKMHAGVDYDVALPLSGLPGIEPRTGGPSNAHQLVVDFGTAVAAGSATVESGTGTIGSFSVSSGKVFVNLSDVSDAQRMVVGLNGVSDGTNVGNLYIPVGILLGDANGDGAVNSGDATITRSRAGQALSTGNFRSDFNVDGSLNSADVTIVRSRSGQFIP